MGLRDLEIKKEYRTNTSNLAKDFYIPGLKNSVLYKRAVGFFSSTSLLQMLEGIRYIIDNGGHIQLIVSPRLSEEDVDAIIKGYRSKGEVIEKSILESIGSLTSETDKKRLALLSELIQRDVLDIKIAFLSKDKKIGMYHEKLGIMIDRNNDFITFSGSMNESLTAFSFNVESIDVFKSWGGDDEKERAESKLEIFDSLWNNQHVGLDIIDFPHVAKERISKIKEEYYEIDLINDTGDFDSCINELSADYEVNSHKKNEPFIPNWLIPRQYQLDAVQNWETNGFKGIFDMATGTGKTITGIIGLSYLFKKQKRLAVIIVAPYTHLIEQWTDELKSFNINPIIGYSDGKYRNYKKLLSNALLDYNIGLTSFLCFITTNASFRTNNLQEIINDFPSDSLIIVDEAHNFGSQRLLVSLPDKIENRLALSATINRHNDPEGTKALYDFFGAKCIEYGLGKAIEEKMLTKYKYCPILTYLEPDELSDYYRLTNEIAKHIKNIDGKIKLSEFAKILLLERSRIIAGARNKIDELLNIIEQYREDTNFLIYCGATNMVNEDLDENEIRQIDLISKILYEKMQIKTSQFTSKEDRVTRIKIIESFLDKTIQGIVAIKCLDEGLNIPSIKTAFILASSTNPKEYIQRRGRVLRLFEGKEYSVIYDFVVLPREINQIYLMLDEEKLSDLGLVRRELKRVFEFSNLSMNQMDGLKLIEEIQKVYPQIKWEEISEQIEEVE